MIFKLAIYYIGNGLSSDAFDMNNDSCAPSQQIFKKYQNLALGMGEKMSNNEKHSTKSSKRTKEKGASKEEAKVTEIPEPVTAVEVETSVADESKKTVTSTECPKKETSDTKVSNIGKEVELAEKSHPEEMSR